MSTLTNTPPFLPSEFISAHALCYRNHDVMLEMLRSGEQQKVFNGEIAFRDDSDKDVFDQSGDIFSWLAATKRVKERAGLLRRIVFPAVLSDFLHFIYEALACSGKAKLTVAFALLRKPLQENLHLMESIAIDVDTFSQKLAEEPHKLAAGSSGGLAAHQRRIEAVISRINEKDRFDSAYLTSLRYDKSEADSFAPIFDPALHLFTGHEAVRTEPLNINFIFSNTDEIKWNQWSFIYSRLPYIMSYARLLFEYVLAEFTKTDPMYLEDIERRISAATILWARAIPEDYLATPIKQFADATKARLDAQCHSQGFRSPDPKDLVQLQENGRLPGEPALNAWRRNWRYSVNDMATRAIRRGIAIVDQFTDREKNNES